MQGDAGGVPANAGVAGQADPNALLRSRRSGPTRTHAAPTQVPRPETLPAAPTAAFPGGCDADGRVRAPATAGRYLVGAVTVALAAAGAFSWPRCHLIRAIIRVGSQDGAVRALPPLARGRVGAGRPGRRLSRPQLGRVEQRLGRGVRSGSGRFRPAFLRLTVC